MQTYNIANDVGNKQLSVDLYKKDISKIKFWHIYMKKKFIP